MRVVVVGGGKMGLPLACQFASRGADVTVCDINMKIVAAINAGMAPFEEPGLTKKLTSALAAQRIRATADTTIAVRDAEVVVIIVPALLTSERDADLAILIAASRAVAAGFKPGTLVCFETTLPLGACRKLLIPVLEESGLRAGKDIDICFSPERVKSLKVFQALERTPKIVGGFDDLASARAEAFYRQYLGAEVIRVSSIEAAEMVKLAGMIYRDLNIALANELGEWCETHGLNVFEIIKAANTDDETSMLFPGIGVGGHCTPVYPHFMIAQAERLGRPVPLVQQARQRNEEEPARNVKRLADVLGSLRGRRVHILGLAFRPGVKEQTCSPAFALRDELNSRGAIVTIEDPLYDDDELERWEFQSGRNQPKPIDALILNTGHAEFAQADFIRSRLKGVRFVLDGRNFWPDELQLMIRQMGCIYLCVGCGNPAVDAAPASLAA